MSAEIAGLDRCGTQLLIGWSRNVGCLVHIAAAILAAGEGSRFDGGEHKLLALLRGRPLIGWVQQAALDARLDATYLVVGATDLPVAPGVTVVQNNDWQHGLATSLRLATSHAGAEGFDGLVVGLADQPLVTSRAWTLVAAALLVAPVAVATYGGRRGHPVGLASTVWPMLPRSGESGARHLTQGMETLVAEVECPEGDDDDVDTAEDLLRVTRKAGLR